jgi:hypothetical protein
MPPMLNSRQKPRTGPSDQMSGRSASAWLQRHWKASTAPKPLANCASSRGLSTPFQPSLNSWSSTTM